MNRPLRILHLEDEPDYSALVRSLLEKEGIQFELSLASNRAEFEAALNAQQADVVLADYLVPTYDGLQALKAVRARYPETPFLIVSGTMGEQAAIESLRCGATDYVLKHWPERLVPAILRAVHEAEERAERRRVETELTRREKYFRTLTENALDVVTSLNQQGQFLYNSPSVERVLGYEAKALVGQSLFGFLHPDDLPAVSRAFERGLRVPNATVRLEFRFRHADGSWRYIEAIGQNRLGDPEIAAVVVNSRDVTDRKQAEDGLRESEKQYRLIFGGNPIPMWVVDQDSLAFLEVNDAAIEHYGYSRAEFLRMTLKDIRPPEGVPALLEYFQQVLNGPNPPKLGLAGVWRHRKKDGTLIDVDIKWSPISFHGRKASLTMANDVTEQRRNELRDAALSKLGQSLSSATSPPEAASIIRAITDELFASDVFTVDLYSAERDRVRPILNVETDRAGRRYEIPTDGREREPSGMARRIIQNGAELILRQEPLAMPSDVMPIGDVTRPSASLMLAPIRNRTKVIGILSIQSYTLKAFTEHDLATLQTLADHCGGALERIRAEQALRSSEMLFHSVWENSVDGMRLTDEQGNIVAVNQAFCELVGMSREELEGVPFTQVYSDTEQPDEILARYRERFRTRTAKRRVERRLTLRNGNVVTLENTTSFVELRGQPPLVLGLFRDVTTQKRLEDQLRQSQKMEAIGQLAGGVAHDFNNILTVIHGHASLLLAAGALSANSQRSAQQITQAAERAAGLTRQLLTFSRRQLMQPRRLDMNEVVGNMTQMLGRILGEDVALQLSYCTQPAIVQADAGMMEQVLLNLVVNARDALPKGGLLAIRIAVQDVDAGYVLRCPEARSGRFVCVSTSDTGCGIPHENLRRIFDPFFTTKEVGKGTGLGLATVYGIVKQHEGWVEVESEVSKGSIFKVFLPCVGASPAVPESRPVLEKARGGNETILVVEDEGPVRELVCNLLETYGYKILQAETGVQALELWRTCRDKVDLVLTDLVMPNNLNGRELAEKLWAESPDLKVVFTSGYSADIVGKDFVLRAGLNFLQKPYDPEKLALVVRDCLDAAN